MDNRGNTKTPLQATVMVICDCLCQLPPEDQPRALEAVRVTLGLSAFKDPAPQGYQAPRPQAPLDEDPEPRQPWENPPARGPLPTVVVQMVNGRPMVANQQVGQAGGRGLVMVGAGSQRAPLRQLPAQRLRQLPASRQPYEDVDAFPLADTPPPRRAGYVRPTR